jgi:hypothetical protein
LTGSEGMKEASSEDDNTNARGEKVMMVIFFSKDSDLLTEYLAHKETINGSSYASFIDR